MIGMLKLAIFALGLLWIMQHVAPGKLPYSLRPGGYSEWGSSRSSLPSLNDGVGKVQESVQGLTNQILRR